MISVAGRFEPPAIPRSLSGLYSGELNVMLHPIARYLSNLIFEIGILAREEACDGVNCFISELNHGNHVVGEKSILVVRFSEVDIKPEIACALWWRAKKCLFVGERYVKTLA